MSGSDPKQQTGSKEMLPPVSVFIITYLNDEARGRVLRDVCLNALALDYPEFEVVVSDNAGGIKAADVLADVDDPRLKIYRNAENVGMAGNMNLCLERCRYHIIKVHCDDDLLHPDCLRLSVPHVDDETYVLVGLEKYTIGGRLPENLSARTGTDPAVEVREPGYGPGNGLWKFRYDGLPGCTLFTRNYFSGMGGYDACSRVEDWDMLIRSRLGRKVAFVDRTLCFQGMWPGSLTEQMLEEEPYFFPAAGLHTKFKVLRDPALSPFERLCLIRLLAFEWVFEFVRMLKNVHRRQYRKGFLEYAAEFRSLCFAGCRRLERGGELP